MGSIPAPWRGQSLASLQTEVTPYRGIGIPRGLKPLAVNSVLVRVQVGRPQGRLSQTALSTVLKTVGGGNLLEIDTSAFRQIYVDRSLPVKAPTCEVGEASATLVGHPKIMSRLVLMAAHQ